MIHVIVADDQALIRGALSALIDLEDDMHVVAQARSEERRVGMMVARPSPQSRPMTLRIPVVTRPRKPRRRWLSLWTLKCPSWMELAQPRP